MIPSPTIGIPKAHQGWDHPTIRKIILDKLTEGRDDHSCRKDLTRLASLTPIGFEDCVSRAYKEVWLGFRKRLGESEWGEYLSLEDYMRSVGASQERLQTYANLVKSIQLPVPIHSLSSISTSHYVTQYPSLQTTSFNFRGDQELAVSLHKDVETEEFSLVDLGVVSGLCKGCVLEELSKSVVAQDEDLGDGSRRKQKLHLRELKIYNWARGLMKGQAVSLMDIKDQLSHGFILDQLEILDTGTVKVDKEDVSKFLSLTPQLRVLRFTIGESIGLEELRKFAERCPKLKELRVRPAKWSSWHGRLEETLEMLDKCLELARLSLPLALLLEAQRSEPPLNPFQMASSRPIYPHLTHNHLHLIGGSELSSLTSLDISSLLISLFLKGSVSLEGSDWVCVDREEGRVCQGMIWTEERCAQGFAMEVGRTMERLEEWMDGSTCKGREELGGMSPGWRKIEGG